MILPLLLASSLFTPRWSEVEAIVRECMAHAPSVGLQIAIARDEKVVFEKGFGLADVENSVPVTQDTVFHADSITKHFTAGLILKLASEGRLSLGDNIGRYVPEFSSEHVTIDQILSHTCGIKSFNDLPEFAAREREDWSPSEVISLIRRSPAQFAAGSSWEYSNSGFYLTGLVAEKASGDTFDELLRKKLTVPFGLRRTSMGLNQPILPHRARGYEWQKDHIVNADDISWVPVFSAGGICTTAGDVVRYELALESGRFIPLDLVHQMRSPHDLLDGTAIDYGYGTRIGSFEGHQAIGHTGSGGGFNNLLVDFPQDHLMVAVLTNIGSGGLCRAVCARVARQLLHLPPADVHPMQLDETVKALKFGTYKTDSGPVKVFLDNGQAYYQPVGAPKRIAVPYLGNLRLGAGPEGEVKLIVKDGTVEWLMFYQVGLFSDAAPRIE